MQASKPVVLPIGSKSAIRHAFRIAIAALEGDKIYPIEQNRPKMSRKLRDIHTALVKAGIVER